MQKCPLCGEGCPEGHFHALDDPQALHLCGKEHLCGEIVGNEFVTNKCRHEGACVIEGEIKIVKRQFHGLRETFEFDYVTEQGMRQKNCAITIPPGWLHHDGPHQCSRPAAEHHCGKPCPMCGYRCACSFPDMLSSTQSYCQPSTYNVDCSRVQTLIHA